VLAQAPVRRELAKAAAAVECAGHWIDHRDDIPAAQPRTGGAGDEGVPRIETRAAVYRPVDVNHSAAALEQDRAFPTDRLPRRLRCSTQLTTGPSDRPANALLNSVCWRAVIPAGWTGAHPAATASNEIPRILFIMTSIGGGSLFRT
jgi:hypothetical protein